MKRLAKKGSLQGTLIEIPDQFYQFVKNHATGTCVEYFPKTEWVKETKALNDRFAAARTIPGTRNVHRVTPSPRNGMVVVRWFSGSETGREVRVAKKVGSSS